MKRRDSARRGSRDEVDGASQESQGFLATAAIVENLGNEEMQHGALGIMLQRSPELRLRKIEVSGAF
jgi:hypothetical protein